MKIFIIQQVIPNYRIPVFNRLSQMPNYDITLIAAKNPEFMDNVKTATDELRCEFKIIWLEQKKFLNRFFYFPRLLSYIRREKPGIIITQNMYYHGFFALVYPLILFKLLKIPIIYWTIPQLNKRKKYELIKPLAFKLIDAFLIYGEHGLQILQNYGIPRKKIFIAYNSIDTEALREIKNRPHSQNTLLSRKLGRLVFMGRLIPSKKVDLLLKAVAQAKQSAPLIELLIIGDGQEKEKLKKISRELRIDQHVKFLGNITDAQKKAEVLLSAGLFVLPGMGGLAINEAMCCDLPIICSTADGTEKQLVYNGLNGFIFKNDDTDDLADKIIKIIRNPQLQQKMSLESAKIIQKKVNIHTMIKGITSAINYASKTKL